MEPSTPGILFVFRPLLLLTFKGVRVRVCVCLYVRRAARGHILQKKRLERSRCRFTMRARVGFNNHLLHRAPNTHGMFFMYFEYLSPCPLYLSSSIATTVFVPSFSNWNKDHALCFRIAQLVVFDSQHCRPPRCPENFGWFCKALLGV